MKRVKRSPEPKPGGLTTSHWRLHARTVIYEVAKRNPKATDKELRSLLSKAYPFGERKMLPYKMWLLEVKHYFEIRWKEPEKAEWRPLGLTVNGGVVEDKKQEGQML